MDDIINSINKERKRKKEELELLSGQVAMLAEKQINVIQVSCSNDSESGAEIWAVVEFSIGNGKWTKFCVKNNHIYASDFIGDILRIVEKTRDKMSIKY